MALLIDLIQQELALLLSDYLFLAFLILVIIHLAINVVYIIYMSKAFRRPWGLNISEYYKPSVTIIVPAYKEAKSNRTKR